MKPLFHQTMILDGIKQLAHKLNQTYRECSQPIVFIGILKGCLPFLMELVKHCEFDLVLDFLIIKSYFGGLKPLKEPQLILDVDVDLTNCEVLIVEDIIETGKTVRFAIEKLQHKKPHRIKVASLLYKKTENNLFQPDYYVFNAPKNSFLVGFGLDYQEQKRNLKYIGVLDNE